MKTIHEYILPSGDSGDIFGGVLRPSIKHARQAIFDVLVQTCQTWGDKIRYDIGLLSSTRESRINLITAINTSGFKREKHADATFTITQSSVVRPCGRVRQCP